MDRSQEGETPLPAYLSRESQDDPLPRLTLLIDTKITNITNLNRRGMELLDDQIVGAFGTAIDQGLKGEAIQEMRRFKKGYQLTREGLIYKDELERDERTKSPVLKLADLIVNKIAGLDALSDEELGALDSSIQAAYTEARKDQNPNADAIMSLFFTEGRKLTTSAQDWLNPKLDAPQNLLGEVINAARATLQKRPSLA